MVYDINNVFAKILRREIPNRTIFEDDFVLAFHDITPAKKIHGVIIPKGPYIDYTDFMQNANAEEITGFHNGILITIKALNLTQNGYRLITNIGEHGGQEVPHLHFHILGGEVVGKLTQ